MPASHTDPPDHKRLREAFRQPFMARNIPAMRGRIAAIANELIDAVGRCLPVNLTVAIRAEAVLFDPGTIYELKFVCSQRGLCHCRSSCPDSSR